MCVCVCVCVRERERESVCVCVCACPEGTVYETDAISIFIKCVMWSLFANPVTFFKK